MVTGACGTCGGSGYVNNDICMVCYGTGTINPTGILPGIMKRVISLGIVADEILDKCDDILDKCNDIFENVSE